jgi:hypothetical protein
MVAKNAAVVARSYSFLPFIKGTEGVRPLPVIGFALALLSGSSTPSHADMGGVLGGILGGMIGQQMQMQRPAPSIYVPPPVYVAPTPVYIAPSPQNATRHYYEPEYPRRAARPNVTKAAPAVATVAKLSKADTAAIEDLRNRLKQFGSGQDIIVLIAAHDTQHVVRDLSGTPQFIRPAQGCFPFKFMDQDKSTPEGRYLKEVIEGAEKKGNGKVKMTPCTSKNFGQYDLLVFSPDQLEPRQNPTIRVENIKPIVDAVDQGSFMQYGDVYTKTDFEADAQARADVIAKDEERRLRGKAQARREFRDRSDADILAIYLKSPATDICVLGVPTDRLVTLLTDRRVPGFDDLLATSTKVLPSADANQVFMSLKQHDCDAVIGTKAMLMGLFVPLNRDNVIFDYHPGSVTPTQMKDLMIANFGEPTARVRQ